MNAAGTLIAIAAALQILCMLDPVSSQAVYTNRYDIRRQGFANSSSLSAASIANANFGKLQSWKVDGAVYGQPLFAPGVMIDGASVDLLIVATQKSSVYAFNRATGETAWSRSFLADGPVSYKDMKPACNDITPYIGILSTPVIDPTTNTIYVLPYTKEQGKLTYRIRALDLMTGKDKFGSPSSPLAATQSFGKLGTVTFDASQHWQRPGLTLYNNTIYAAFASHCDAAEFHPWIFGIDAASLQTEKVFVTPLEQDEIGPGIWQSGAGLVIFNNSMYVALGNGGYDPANSQYGDSVLRLSLPDLAVRDYWTPSDQANLDDNDLDFGSSAPIPVLNDEYVFVGGKEGTLYLLNSSALGGYNPNNNDANSHSVIDAPANTELGTNGIYSGGAYWPGGSQGAGSVFTLGRFPQAGLRQYSLTGAKLAYKNTINRKEGNFTSRAGVPIVSASNQNASQALVWAIDANSTLFAWDAASLTQLWSSLENKGDAPMCSTASFVKFATPTVLDDMVYIGCSDQLIGYGLKIPIAPEGQLSAFSGPSAEAPLPVGPTETIGPTQPVQPSGPIGPTASIGPIGR